MKELIKKSIDWFVMGAIIIYVVAIAWVLIDNLDKSGNKCCVISTQDYQVPTTKWTEFKQAEEGKGVYKIPQEAKVIQ